MPPPLPTRPTDSQPAALPRRSMIGTALAVPVGSVGPLARPTPGKAQPNPRDAEIVRLCDAAHALDVTNADESAADTADAWDELLVQLAPMRPDSLAALHAKAVLALATLPSAPGGGCPDWPSPEERLLRHVLEDVLAMIDRDERR